MYPAALPAGPEPTPAPAGFTRVAACRIVGLTLPELERWELAIGAETGLRLAPCLTFADLLGLAFLREASWALCARVADFNLGLGQLFEILGSRPDIEQLDDFAALIGRDFARLAELRRVHLRCARDDFIIVPLRPILADLRDQVCS
jgi:hypothetical protein